MEYDLKERFLPLLVISVILALLTGCGGGGGSATDKFKGDTSGSWTVLIFLNADNDLERFGILNMNQMEKIGSTDQVKIVVQMDRSPGYDSSNGNWTGTRRYLVTKDNDTDTINSTMLEDMGEVDMGDPDVLREFIQWGQQNYPADRYCLVLWNHGSGWRTAAQTKALSRNISFDDTSGTSIQTTDLAYALEAASPRIDCVAFDASLMQMIEVAYEMRNSAEILVGSEESPPGDGYVYDRWLGRLAASPGMNSRQLGQVIADEYVDSYTGKYDVTQSVLVLANVDAVARAADDFAAAVRPHAASNASALRTARTNAQSYAFDYYKDLLDYASLVNQVIPDPAISNAYTRLQSAMSSAVVYERHTGTRVERSHGLSIYMPSPWEYLTRYEDIGFSAEYPNWAELIKAQTQ